jgi:hypothetical protein
MNSYPHIYNITATMTRDQGKRSPTTGERRLTERTGEQSIREKLQAAIDTAIPIQSDDAQAD